MSYGLREYAAAPDPMPALIRRIDEHALKGLAKHEMEVVSSP